mgnify:FL=1
MKAKDFEQQFDEAADITSFAGFIKGKTRITRAKTREC